MTTLIRPRFEPTKIFEHATAFHRSYELLQGSILAADGSSPTDQDVALIGHPALTLSAFASELYLKCLICIETGDVPIGHNLQSLFMKLRVETRRSIDDLWDTDIREPGKMAAIEKMRAKFGGNPIRTDLRYALTVGGNGFIELRYFYEGHKPHFLLSHFPYVVRRAILRNFPSWGGILPKPAKGLTR